VGEQVVGVDTSSLWPPEVEALPKVGYQRAVAVEGVLSLKPTAVFAVHEAGPPAALEQLKQAGVRLVQFADVTTPEAAEARLRQLGEALGRKERAEELALQMRQSLASTAKRIESRAARPRALLIYARGAGQAFVAGKGTSAETALRLAGASPAVDNLEGFRPLTSEAVLLAAPEVVVVPKRALQSLGGEEGLWALPGLAQTPAGASKRLVLVDDSALLGFGPRMPDAVAALAQALHPEEP
jgi:iron complex transport system substrate-binding protein